MLENIIPTEIIPTAIIPTEIAAEHADKTQIGAFAQSTRFTAYLDETGIGLSLERRGPDEQGKSEDMHFHYVLFSDILRDLAHTAWTQPPDDIAYRDALRDSARTLYIALETNPNKVLKVRSQRAKGDGHAIRSSV
jgi:hypothetical protein